MSALSSALAVKAPLWRFRAGSLPGVLAFLALTAIAFTGNEDLVVLATQTLIFILFAVSLNLLVGYAGLISVGHAAVYATGGYVAGHLAKTGNAGFAAALAAGIVASGILAGIMAAISVRREKTYFIMLTLAVAQLVSVVISKWKAVTGGDDGLIGFAPPPALQGSTAYYVFTALLVVLSLVGIHRLVSSPYGRALRAIRDNPQRASFTGINVARLQISVFVISGLFAGLAGSLMAFHQRGMFIQSSSFLTSTDALVVCVLGGPRYFAGPIVGAILFRVLTGVLPDVTAYWASVLGLVILLIGRFLPGGLLSILPKAEGTHEGTHE